MSYPTRLLEYELPEELIAQSPAEKRDHSRLLVMSRDTASLEHRVFTDIVEYIRPGDLLVLNDTRVFPARYFARKETGARIELLFLEELPVADGRQTWEALARPSSKLRNGMPLFASGDVSEKLFTLEERLGEGRWQVTYEGQGTLTGFLDRHGIVPLPPYVKSHFSDAARYQTVYAQHTGSTAAPTAGLHFTDDLMRAVESRGAEFAKVTLHIGLDTFRPIKTESVDLHQMHTERYIVKEETARAVAAAKANGGRVIAVGTTAVRSLESWAAAGGLDDAAGRAGATGIYIYRREHFRVIDALITNFHLPCTTLLALVSAFAGREFVLAAYSEAIARRYRFFSFGDATLIL